MADNIKSILAETLEEIQTVKQQLEENANFALTSTLKDELGEIIKKGITENFASEEDDETTEDIPADDTAGDSIPTDQTADLESSSDDSIELGDDEERSSMDLDGDDEEVIDLTAATPEEVIGSFKLMAPTDSIEIVGSQDGIAIMFNKGEKTTSDDNSIASAVELPPVSGEEDMSPEVTPDDAPVPDEEPVEEPSETSDEEEEENLYEIEITEDDEIVDEAMSHNLNMKKRNITHNGNDPLRVDETEEVEEETVTETEEKVEDVKESHNKLVASRKKIQALMLENKKLKSELGIVNENVTAFTLAEKEYKEAISTLKTKLHEIALYTSNNTYALKLMTENTTTKNEKLQILKRLDTAKTINESREIFISLDATFKAGNNNNANTVIKSKILKEEKTSGASKLNETVAYSNPQVDRIREIIKKIT